MTSATDELHYMLDERGVEYQWTDQKHSVPSCEIVQWWSGDDVSAEYIEYHDGSTVLHIHTSMLHATPAQAIAATLGAGTCRLKRAQWDDGTCTWGCICTACDAHLEHETGIGYNYCPHCGRKVVDE